MLQRYKLRLGDGTVLLVDRDGLSPWLVDRQATVQPEGSRNWRPLREFLALERAAARRETRLRSVHESLPPRRPSSAHDESGPAPREDGLPLVPPPPKHEATPPTPTPVPREDGLPLVPPPADALVLPAPENPPVAPAPGGEPRHEDKIAPSPLAGVDPDVVASAAAIPEDRGSFSFDPAELLESASLSESATPEAEAESPAEPFETASRVEPEPTTTPDAEPPATILVGVPRTVAVEELAPPGDDAVPGMPPDVQALADDPGFPLPAPEREDPGPQLRIEVRSERKAILSPPPRRRSESPTAPSAETSRAGTSSAVPSWATHPVTERLLHGAAALGSVLGRSVEPINRLERGLPPVEIDEGALTRARARGRALLSEARRAVAEWPARLRERRAARDEEEDDGPLIGLAPEERVARPTVVPVADDPELEPEPEPAPVRELPALRFATTVGPETGDVYPGAEPGSFLPALWRWTVWLALLAALGGGAALAVVSWRVWFPPTAVVGDRAFREIDRQAHAAERDAQRQAVLEEAAARLPYLAPETVEQILARSPTGLLGIPDIFEAACDAADWGSWVLTPGERDELRGLREQMLQALEPADQERVRSYDRARASGLVFPLDNRLGTLLWARGTQALPAEGRERLRVLLGRAIAAGLTPSGGSTRTARER
jgi:hypothetical protein